MTSPEICALIEQETGQAVTEATPLEALQIDSLEFLNLLLIIGDAAGKEISDRDVSQAGTVGDLVKACA